MSLSAKMIDRRTSTPKGNHSYGPFFLEYSLLAEYNLLQKQRLPGIYVIPSSKSSLEWFGVVFVRQGIYQEGIFRFKLLIPENYPDGDCPRLTFDHNVFHPLVDPETFELDVRRAFPKWKRNVNHIWQVLFFTRKIFYKIETSDPLNQEAADMYGLISNVQQKQIFEKQNFFFRFNQSLESFRGRVKECVSEWQNRLYDKPASDDPHFLTFSPYDSDIHSELLKAMKSKSEVRKQFFKKKQKTFHAFKIPDV
jgi:ubiquitin-protein ligase